MKWIITIVLVLFFTRIVAQSNDSTIATKDTSNTIVKDSNETSESKNLVNVKHKADTTRIRVGHKSITIIKNGKTTVTVQDITENDEISNTITSDLDDEIRSAVEEAVEEAVKSNKEANEIAEAARKAVEDIITQLKKEKQEKPKIAKFNSIWNGISIGLNNFTDKNNSIANSPEFMSLNSSSSVNLNLQFFGLPIKITNNMALVSGMGLEWNNYRFSNKNSIVVDSSGVTVDLPFGRGVEKSKLKTVYFNIPLALEFHIPTDRSQVKILFGVIGGGRIGTKTKVNYHDGKDINHDDLNISPFRYGYIASIGYKAISLYINYYATPLFIKDKGPELYPFSIGLHLGFPNKKGA